jgi:phosphoglycolate phosphatase-like HAD superfamily hydrolase
VTETLLSTVAARPQLVIFDLDGTLTDSAQGIVSSFRHALGEVGAEIPDGDLAGRLVGPPMHQTLTARSPPTAPTTRPAAGR